MKYECQDCKKQFLHTAKYSHFIQSKDIEPNSFAINLEDAVERYVCPYCYSLNIIDVLIEQQPKGKIIALVSVPNNAVNDFLAEGYEVMEDKIYAKETVLIKREKLQEEQKC